MGIVFLNIIFYFPIWHHVAFFVPLEQCPFQWFCFACLRRSDFQMLRIKKIMTRVRQWRLISGIRILTQASPNQEDTYMMRLLMGEQEISDVKRRHYVHCIHCRILNGQGFVKSTQHSFLYYINSTMRWNLKIWKQSWNLCIFA